MRRYYVCTKRENITNTNRHTKEVTNKQKIKIVRRDKSTNRRSYNKHKLTSQQVSFAKYSEWGLITPREGKEPQNPSLSRQPKKVRDVQYFPLARVPFIYFQRKYVSWLKFLAKQKLDKYLGFTFMLLAVSYNFWDKYRISRATFVKCQPKIF